MRDSLLQPIQLRNLTLKNRIYSSAHAPLGFLENGRPGERYALYHEEKAKGGLALTLIGGSSNVDIDSENVFDNFYAGGEDILPFYEDVTTRVHRHGAHVGVQITHLGRRSQSTHGAQLPSISPSLTRERAHRSYPKLIERHDIARVISAFGRAARLAKSGGMDIVEVLAVGGHLIDQFWAARTNQRTDEFGGSLKNRMRFGFMVVEAVRDAVGDDMVVGLRMPGDEGVSTGLHRDECLEIASTYATSTLIDYISIVYGAGQTARELSEVLPGFGRPLGAHIEMAGDIRREVSIPIFHAGRIADIETARHAVDAGFVDMVAMVRAQIADPYLVRKLVEGHPERIRPCVGASMCLGPETQCIHNPATGRERTIPQLVTRADVRREIAVVGGGAGGLEAARVCAERGHRVTLFEADSELGGQWRFASRPSRHSEKRSIIAWLESEVRRLGVTVRRNVLAGAKEVMAAEPDVVIIATGGLPNIRIGEVPEQLIESCVDAIGSRALPGRRTLIYDDNGGEAAATTAEYLATGGEIVELVTPDRQIGHDIVEILTPDYLRELYCGGVTLTTDHELVDVVAGTDAKTASLQNVYSDRRTDRQVDRVVVEQGTLPVADLYRELSEGSINKGEVDLASFVVGAAQLEGHGVNGGYELFRIGDAVSHRGIQAAIFDARRLCMRL